MLNTDKIMLNISEIVLNTNFVFLSTQVFKLLRIQTIIQKNISICGKGFVNRKKKLMRLYAIFVRRYYNKIELFVFYIGLNILRVCLADLNI